MSLTSKPGSSTRSIGNRIKVPFSASVYGRPKTTFSPALRPSSGVVARLLPLFATVATAAFSSDGVAAADTARAFASPTFLPRRNGRPSSSLSLFSPPSFRPTALSRPDRVGRHRFPPFASRRSGPAAAAMSDPPVPGDKDGVSGGTVVVVGSINQDLTTYAGSLPTPGQTLLGSDFRSGPGGKGANQAVAAASIGIVAGGEEGVAMIGRVGADDMGKVLLAGLKRRGVRMVGGDGDCSEDAAAIADGAHTGVASIVVDSSSGENTIVVAPGANLALSPDDVRSSLRRILPPLNAYACGKNATGGGRNVVVVQLEIRPESALEALRVGSELGALTILNPAPAPERGSSLLEEFYPSVDFLVPNESELAALCGDSGGARAVNGNEEAMAASLLERGVRRAVIVTLGARGAMIVARRQGDCAELEERIDGAATKKPRTDAAKEKQSTSTRTIMIDAPPDLPARNEPIADAVGAGDAFCGALAAYLSRGMDLDEAASLACGVASMSVRKRGAQESYPTAEELPKCLRLNGGGVAGGGGGRKKPILSFVTGNKNKLAEVRRILKSSPDGRLPFEVTNVKIDLPELQGNDALEIAREKCLAASRRCNGAVFTEDTSLCFCALSGLPGPYIKWFFEKLGHDGLNDMLVGFDDKSAYAETVVAFCPGPDCGEGGVSLFVGRTLGTIVRPRGSLDFGWDPIFEPSAEEAALGTSGGGEGGRLKTYAEMDKEEKDAISHRGRAFSKFRQYLLSRSSEITKEIEESSSV